MIRYAMFAFGFLWRQEQQLNDLAFTWFDLVLHILGEEHAFA